MIRPALAGGADVVCDRYIDSSLAYQGIARGLGVERVLEVNLAVTASLLPDRTFLLLVPAEVAAQRRGSSPDRIESEGDEFAAEVDRAYRQIAEIFSQRVVVVTGQRSRKLSPRKSMDTFETFPEQEEAKGLLRAALAEGPAHAYLFHGPRGVGKRRAALAFAGTLLGDPDRVSRHAHPDLYVLEPLGDQIRIDPVRELRRDLHMRPFEASRRVYLVFGAHTMNEDAADALLKDLEEPPDYAVIVLVADDLGPLAPTIRSRCQHIPFRRLSQRAVKAYLSTRGVEGEKLDALARLAGGRLDRADRLLNEEAGQRRAVLIELARSVYRDPAFDPAAASGKVGELAQARAAEARAEAEAAATGEESSREHEQRVRRVGRGAEREEILDALDILSSWYRDLVVAAAGAEGAVVNSDRLAELAEDGVSERSLAAERAAEAVRETWRSFEFQVQTGLALEGLFVRLRRELASPAAAR